MIDLYTLCYALYSVSFCLAGNVIYVTKRSHFRRRFFEAHFDVLHIIVPS
jgi:hypothetical protein